MIYNGKEKSLELQEVLKSKVAQLAHTPALTIISASKHPSIKSFISIKRTYAEAVGVAIQEFVFDESVKEEELLSMIHTVAHSGSVDGIIVQLPLPAHIDTDKILSAIPNTLDVDVLGSDAIDDFKNNTGLVPPVAKAVAHILEDTQTEIENKNVVVIGHGRLVGAPVAQWFITNGVTPTIIDIHTDDEAKHKALKEADVVVSGIGVPHHLTKELLKEGAILIDAGTSEQFGKLAGDFDPECANIASVFTPVPGGVGPLTVACLFENVVRNAKENMTK